jgi:hypothetical protein
VQFPSRNTANAFPLSACLLFYMIIIPLQIPATRPTVFWSTHTPGIASDFQCGSHGATLLLHSPMPAALSLLPTAIPRFPEPGTYWCAAHFQPETDPFMSIGSQVTFRQGSQSSARMGGGRTTGCFLCRLSSNFLYQPHSYCLPP